MKTQLKFLFVCIFFLLAQFFFGCQKEENDVYEVNFGVGVSDNGLNSALKCSPENDLSNARYIVITIKKANGGVTKYNSSKIDIYTLYGVFYSQKILLSSGSYMLTEFLISDSTGNIIFAVPTTGSVLASGISKPLPISFNLEKNKPTLVSLDVVSTEGTKCNDFGLAWFPVKEVKVSKIPVAILDNQTAACIPAELTVTFDTYSKVINLEAKANNLIAIPDGFTQYLFRITNPDYEEYLYMFSADSLNTYVNTSGNVPLTIELKRRIITITDVDGNTYKAVKIGNQIWMAENLRTTKYADGTPIPYVNSKVEWDALTETSKAYCYNNDDPSYAKPYGALYTWVGAMNGKNSSITVPSNVQGVCPSGWHLPSHPEWLVLIDYLGGGNIAGGKLKETGTLHWNDPNTGATNESGFTAVPAGIRYLDGSFYEIGVWGNYWTSSSRESSDWPPSPDDPEPNNQTGGQTIYIPHNDSYITIDVLSRNVGASVRCVKN